VRQSTMTRFSTIVAAATLVAMAGCGTQSLAAGPQPSSSPTGWHSSPAGRVTASATPTGSPTGSPAPSRRDPLAGHAFVSTSVTRRGVPKTLVDGVPIRIWLPPGGRLDVWDACNTLTGNYQVDGSRFSTSHLATEHKNCSAAGVAQGSWLHGIFSSAPHWTVSGLTGHPGHTGGTLVLTWQDTVLRFNDTALLQPAPPMTPLDGTPWIVDTVYSGAAAADPPSGARATLTFTSDGRVSGSAGCNAFGGRAVAGGQTITFSEIITTMMACGGGRDALERSVKAVLNAGHVTYTLTGAHLTLRASTGAGLRLSPTR
jgi:heat shock protein HslJ